MDRPARPELSIFLAYAALLLIWGSTYLAIGFHRGDIPPFFSGSLRFLIAGSIRWRGALRGERTAAWPDTRRPSGGGSCSSAARRIGLGPADGPSSMAALIITRGAPVDGPLRYWLHSSAPPPSLPGSSASSWVSAARSSWCSTSGIYLSLSAGTPSGEWSSSSRT